jgi:hypothetical protein
LHQRFACVFVPAYLGLAAVSSSFSSLSIQHFDSFLVRLVMTPSIKMYLQFRNIFFLFETVTSRNLCQNVCTLDMGMVFERLFQCVTVVLQFDTSNVADLMLIGVARA